MEQESSKSHDKYLVFKRINDAIRTNNQKEISAIYQEHIHDFFRFIRKHFQVLAEDELISIYNDSLQFVFEQSRSGKLMFYGAKFHTYLFAVGLNRAYSYIRNNKTNDPVMENISEWQNILSGKDPEVNASDFQLIMDLVNKMKAPCDIILSLTYEGFELSSIAEVIERTPNATKTKRSECLKSLRAMLEKIKIRKEDIYGR